jgi:putative peptidoglycan lipid II flippase
VTRAQTLFGKRQRIGTAALLLSACSFLSVFIGLARDKVISWQFGAGAETDMYFAAFVVPDSINYLLAGGLMVITIIPLLSRRFQEDETDAWRFFSCIFCWMLTAATILTLCGVLAAEHLARLIAPGFTPEKCARLAFFMRIILPGQIFFLCGACVTALLYIRRQFIPSALAPIIYNASIISCGVLLPQILPVEGMTGYCIGVTLGAFLGAFLIPLRTALSRGMPLRPGWRHPLLGKLLLTSLPLLLGITIVMLDEQFLRVFGSLAGEGVVSLLAYARRVAQVPVKLVGQAAAAASYPFLVLLLTSGDNEGFERTLRSALNATLGIIIPCAIWMTVQALPILCAIFQGGRFTPEDTQAATLLAQILLAPTPLWVVYALLARGFYARGDTVTPALTGSVATLLCLPCYYYWAVPAGAWAIAAVSATGISLYVLWLVGLWIKRYGAEVFSGLPAFCARTAACALPGAALSGWISEYCLRALPYHPLVAACIALAVGGCVFALTFLPLAHIFAPSVTQTVLRYFLKKDKPADHGNHL